MTQYLITVVLFIVCTISLSKAGVVDQNKMMKAFMDVAEACKTEVGALQTDIDDIIAMNPAAGSEGKCLRACVLQKFGVMDAAGNLVKESAFEHAKEFLGDDPVILQKAAQVIEECATKALPGDRCESAEQIKSCFKTAAKANGVEHIM